MKPLRHLLLTRCTLAATALLAVPQAAWGQAPGSPAPAGISVSVTLDQGVVDVKSTQGPVSLYREKVVQDAQDFDAFKKQITDGVRKEQEAFKKYKEQTSREFVGYVESITLQAGTQLTISGNTAVERQGGADDNAARDFMKRWRAEGDTPKTPGRSTP